MIAAAGDQIKTVFTMGHLGLVGAFIRETGIIESIDSMVPESSDNPGPLTHGQVAALLILNWFGGADPHLKSSFFEARDAEAILGITFDNSWYNDDVIAHTLDALHASGLTPLFSRIASEVMKRLGCKIGSVTADSIGFRCQNEEQPRRADRAGNDYDEPRRIAVTYGYNGDYPPEAVLIREHVLTDSATGMPLCLEPEDNAYDTCSSASDNNDTAANDTAAFSRMIKVFESFGNYCGDSGVYLSGDDSLYTEEQVTFMAGKGIKFAAAVDSKRKSAQDFIAARRDDPLENITDEYQGRLYAVNDCGVRQIWLLVQSAAAAAKNAHAAETSAAKEKDKLRKLITDYDSTYYASEKEAQKELQKIRKKCRYCQVVSSAIVKEEIPGKDRKSKKPGADSQKEFRCRLDITIEINREYCDMVARTKSLFVVATNDAERQWTPGELLKLYNPRNKKERAAGWEWQFLKNSAFFADRVFAAGNERIQTLLMIMTLGLLVSRGLEWKLRKALETSEVLFKKPAGQITGKISLGYVFQIFRPVMTIVSENGERKFCNLDEQAIKILELLGAGYQKAYGACDADDA
ncbi:IS1634 family transposase [Succinimonas sp.]|uniref:IS1634 family transposase n=1 Tax=Succinimonas sp. TaxID=1936151 RepID=UPI0038680879